MRFLIVDDTRSVHAFVTNLMSKLNVTDIIHVFNGHEAFQMLERDTNFDIIFLDWEMPVMTGPETLAALKTKGVPIPVVMMTTKNSPADIQRMLEAGAVEYMMKPFTVDILADKIYSVTGKSLSYAG